MMYKIYIQLRSGKDGYYENADIYGISCDERYGKAFPTYKSALSKAKSIKQIYSQIGYIEVVKS